MDDILESIESGVAEERGRGTLNQAQADVRLPPLCFFVVECLLIIAGPVFRICSRKCGTSKPGLDDIHLLLCIPFGLLMY